ncbi:MAG: hypothetical protein HRT82_06925 [Henriciella sp.]|nr:hypothetical protein [Henriciella sp.]
MVWDGRFGRWKAALRIAVIAAIHLAILSWILASKFVIQSASPPISFSIEIAELTPLPEALMPEPEPVPVLPPIPPDEPSPAAVPTPPASTPTPARVAAPSEPPASEEQPTADAPQHPAVLTHDETTAGSEPNAAVPSPSTGSDSDAVTPDQIASLLKQIECQKLTHRVDESCPYADEFTAWTANTERATVERNTEWDRSFRSKSTIDKFYEREVRGRLHWPDEDLFADPLPPGANDAERIRRGQEPLWSKEMRDGFRKSDEE